MHTFKLHQAWVLPCLAIALGAVDARGQSGGEWKIHDPYRSEPKVVSPGALNLPAAPPSDAIVLFDGSDLSAWRHELGGPAGWKVENGYMEAVGGSGSIRTAQGFGDIQLHMEWATPAIVRGSGQGRGNSGVFLMGLYELQILDSYENDTYADGQAASLYGQYPPLVNASLVPGAWQSYDIVFRRPRFATDGNLLEPARMTVFHNGVLVQNNAELKGPSGWLMHLPYEEHAPRQPILLQDHSAPVRFRNIWVRELPETEPPGPARVSETPAMPLDADIVERYVGRYRAGSVTVAHVFRDEEQLYIDVFDDDNVLALIPHSPTEFSFPWTEGRVDFTLDDEGVPTAIRIRTSGIDASGERAP
jgi:hypothetical protein